MMLQQSFRESIQLKDMIQFFSIIVGKIKVLKKCLNEKRKSQGSKKKWPFMFRDVEKFNQIVSCFGKEEEGLSEIRARM